MTNRNELWIKQTSLIKSELKNMIGVSTKQHQSYCFIQFELILRRAICARTYKHLFKI